MKNIKNFESLRSPISEQDNDYEPFELLVDMMEHLKQPIKDNFEKYGMEADFVEINDPTEFIVEYWPKAFDGRIPKKISYYIDEISNMITGKLGTNVDWEFSPNGNVQRIVFSLDEPINPKIYKAMKSLRYT